MYKVLLVDDEVTIIEGLKVIINWDRLKCTIAGTAQNAMDAAILADQIVPDLIISDINMLNTNGLDLIKFLREKGCPSKFILISGFSEFEYAKKAISLGVHSYILKPIDEYEMEDAIQEAIIDIESERFRDSLLRQSEIQRENYKNMIFQHMIDTDSESEAYLIELLESASITLKNLPFISLFIETSHTDKALLKENMNRISEHLRDLFERDFSGVSFRMNLSLIGAILYPKFPDLDYKRKQEVELLYAELKGCSVPIVSIAVSSLHHSKAELKKAFQEARDALSYRLLIPQSVILDFEELMKEHAQQEQIPVHLLNELDQEINDLHLEATRSKVDEICSTLQMIITKNPASFRTAALNVMLACLRNLPIINLHQNDSIGLNLLKLFDDTRKLSEVGDFKRILNKLTCVLIEAKSVKLPSKGDLIDNVKQYISENYRQDITLVSLSEHYFINPYYLSQLFKRKTGETYLSYITNVRIEKSKQLLATTNAKIYEICIQVGYVNVKYFSKIFEKYVGCKPSEYRARHHK